MSGFCFMIEYGDSDDASPLLDKCRHLMVHQYFRSMSFGVDDIRQGEPERVYRPVGHFHRTYNRGVYGRFYQPCLGRVYYLRIDARSPARLYEQILVGEVVFRKGNEQSSVFFYAMACYLPENHILCDALGSGLPVGYRITGAAMEQSMVSPGSAGSKIKTFYKQNPHSAQGAIPRRTRSGSTSTYDDDVKFVHFAIKYHVFIILVNVVRYSGFVSEHQTFLSKLSRFHFATNINSIFRITKLFLIYFLKIRKKALRTVISA